MNLQDHLKLLANKCLVQLKLMNWFSPSTENQPLKMKPTISLLGVERPEAGVIFCVLLLVHSLLSFSSISCFTLVNTAVGCGDEVRRRFTPISLPPSDIEVRLPLSDSSLGCQDGETWPGNLLQSGKNIPCIILVLHVI